MFRKTYDWVMGLAGSRHASKALAAVSFAESSFFPIPPDVMLAPMVLARPDRAFVYAGAQAGKPSGTGSRSRAAAPTSARRRAQAKVLTL